MAKDKVKIEGLIFKKRRDTAPEWIKGQMSVKVEEFTAFIKKHSKNGWVNFNILQSKEGELYPELDIWEPSNTRPAAPAPRDEPKQVLPAVEESDDLPF